MTLKEQKEQRLIELIEEYGDFEWEISQFNLTGRETDEELSQIALSFHINFMLDGEKIEE